MPDPVPPRSSPSVPDRLFVEFQSAIAGRYSLERELGRGGMGVVYLAREVRLDRPVAIKVLPPGRASDQALRERFLREARTAAKLSHPHIIPIHAVDEAGAFVFFAMAYVEGETLTERVRRSGALSPAETARVLREVAWALAHAHAHGVVHRDVKPDNILLETASGRALVMDFGIAAVLSGAAGLDGGHVTGTPEFMSPEQALGERVDARSDLYSLGATGFLALAGRLVFSGASATEVLAKHVTEPAPPMASVVPGIPRRLAETIDRCLAKAPEERPAGAQEIAARMGTALERRREIPAALQVFVRGQTEVSEANVVATAVLGLAGAGMFVLVISSVVDSFTDAKGWWIFGTSLGLFVVAAPLALIARAIRRVARQGYEPVDLAQAFRAHLDQTRETRLLEHGAGAGLFERLMRTIAVGTLGGAAVVLASILTFPIIDDSVWSMFGALLTTGIGTGLITVMRVQRRHDLAGQVWWRVWSRKIGKVLFSLATLGLKREALSPAATHRPTELALSLAAEKLFEDLPRESRRQLGELPDVVRRLERDAKRMRERLEELQDAIGGTGDRSPGTGNTEGELTARRDRVLQDLIAERDAVQRRLTDAVAALETIRLSLLKLHAGSTTVQSLTTDLGLARDVAKEIDLLLASRRETDDLLA